MHGEPLTCRTSSTLLMLLKGVPHCCHPPSSEEHFKSNDLTLCAEAHPGNAIAPRSDAEKASRSVAVFIVSSENLSTCARAGAPGKSITRGGILPPACCRKLRGESRRPSARAVC